MSVCATPLTAVGIATAFVSGCSAQPQLVNPPIPEEPILVFDYNSDGAKFLCSKSAVDSGDCAAAYEQYCHEQGKELLEGVTVLAEKDGYSATGRASCYVPGKEIQ